MKLHNTTYTNKRLSSPLSLLAIARGCVVGFSTPWPISIVVWGRRNIFYRRTVEIDQPLSRGLSFGWQ